MFLTSPITNSVLPRLIRLNAEGNSREFIGLYRNSTQMTSLIALPVAFAVATFSEQVVYAWTGSYLIAEKVAPILVYYSIGYGMVVTSAFPSYLQVAKGNLRLHLIGSILFIVILVPSMVWFVTLYGSVGAGYAWLATNILSFLIWPAVVHNSLINGLHVKWLKVDVLPILITVIILTYPLSFFEFDFENRIIAITVPVLIGIGILLITTFSSSWARIQIANYLRER